jgi:hypothetical protein
MNKTKLVKTAAGAYILGHFARHMVEHRRESRNHGHNFMTRRRSR